MKSKLNDSSLSEKERRKTAEEIVKELANATNLDDKDESKRLTETDLVTTVNIVSDIVKLNISNASLRITTTVSNILNPKNKKTWDVVEVSYNSTFKSDIFASLSTTALS